MTIALAYVVEISVRVRGKRKPLRLIVPAYTARDAVYQAHVEARQKYARGRIHTRRVGPA